MTGPFHTALRHAIHATGLSLERLQDRLARRGHRVSVSTLSNWQRGTSRPEHARSREALAALEELVGVPPNALLNLLGPRRPRLTRDEASQGMSSRDSNRLRRELGAPELSPASPLTVLSVRERYVAGPTRQDWYDENRMVIRANRSGVDRHVAMFHTHHGVLPEVSAGETCRIGRVREEPGSGLVAVELLFDRPLMRGETYPLEFRHRCADQGESAYIGRWFRAAGVAYDLEVRFTTPEPPVACHRIWRLDPGNPHKDVAAIPLIHGRIAHLYDPALEPGFHGIRWEWPAAGRPEGD